MNDMASIGQWFEHINGDEYEVIGVTERTISLMELSGEVLNIATDDFLRLLRTGTLEPVNDDEESEDFDKDDRSMQ